MILYYLNDKSYNNNKIIFYKDNSYGKEKCGTDWDVQLCLADNGSLILNFDSWSKNCTSCEGYLPIGNIVNKSIIIPKYIEGSLNIDINEEEKNNIWLKYYLSDKTVLFDETEMIVAFGTINDNGVIRFGKGQYASFIGEKLCGIIISFSNKY